jgi:hypothetical protein
MKKIATNQKKTKVKSEPKTSKDEFITIQTKENAGLFLEGNWVYADKDSVEIDTNQAVYVQGLDGAVCCGFVEYSDDLILLQDIFGDIQATFNKSEIRKIGQIHGIIEFFNETEQKCVPMKIERAGATFQKWCNEITIPNWRELSRQ